MEINDLDIPSPEEIKKFYEILEKMNKIEQKIQKENSVADTEPLSLFIRLKLDIDIVENGSSLTVSENVLEKIKTHYEIPVLKNQNAQSMTEDIVSNMTTYLQNLIKEKYDV